MNAREREVMEKMTLEMRDRVRIAPIVRAALIAWSDQIDALIADTRAGEGVEAVAYINVAAADGLRNPSNPLGGTVTVSREPTASANVPIYLGPQPAQGGQGQQEGPLHPTQYRYYFHPQPDEHNGPTVELELGMEVMFGEVHEKHFHPLESAQSQTPPKEQGNDTRRWLSDEDVQAFCSTRSHEQGQRREITDEDTFLTVIERFRLNVENKIADTCLDYKLYVPLTNYLNEQFRAVLEWYESTRAPQPHNVRGLSRFHGRWRD